MMQFFEVLLIPSQRLIVLRFQILIHSRPLSRLPQAAVKKSNIKLPCIILNLMQKLASHLEYFRAFVFGLLYAIRSERFLQVSVSPNDIDKPLAAFSHVQPFRVDAIPLKVKASLPGVIK